MGFGNQTVPVPWPAVYRYPMPVPTIINTSTGSINYSAPSALVRFLGQSPTAPMTQPEAAPSTVIRYQSFGALALTGDLVYVSPSSALMRFLGGAAAGVTPQVSLIQFRRGPISKLPPGWPEGAPYEAGILTGVGDEVFEMLFLGGHDGKNKLVGGGFQTCSGEPGWTPTLDGTWVPAVFDTTNLKLWIYSGGAWHYIQFT